MGKGRCETDGLRRNKKKKNVTLMLCLVLLLVFAAGGTLAYVMTKSSSVQNLFQRAYVDATVNVDGDTITVINGDNNMTAFIRAAVVVNWMDDQGNVRGTAPTDSDYSLGINGIDWYQDPTTMFYYYKSSVAAGDSTNALVTSISVNVTPPEGYSLSVEVVAEAIQAEGDTDDDGTPAYQDAWGITSIDGN